jgi:hypothetical protein
MNLNDAKLMARKRGLFLSPQFGNTTCSTQRGNQMQVIPEGNGRLVNRPEHGGVGIGDEPKGNEVDAEIKRTISTT